MPAGENMSNIRNIQNFTGQQRFSGLFSSQNTGRFSSAPSSIYKYSINEVLREKDEFRKDAQEAYKYSQKHKKNMNTFKKLLAFGASIGAILLLEAKKII